MSHCTSLTCYRMFHHLTEQKTQQQSSGEMRNAGCTWCLNAQPVDANLLYDHHVIYVLIVLIVLIQLIVLIVLIVCIICIVCMVCIVCIVCIVTPLSSSPRQEIYIAGSNPKLTVKSYIEVIYCSIVCAEASVQKKSLSLIFCNMHPLRNSESPWPSAAKSFEYDFAPAPPTCRMTACHQSQMQAADPSASPSLESGFIAEFCLSLVI